MNVPVLLALAWVAYLARYVPQFLAHRRDVGSSLPGLPKLPEPSNLASRAAAYSRQPLGYAASPHSGYGQRARSRATQRRLNVLCSLSGISLLSFLAGVMTSARSMWALCAISVSALSFYVWALIQRRNARRQEYVERLWAKDRYDDLGNARVMSLQEARNRAERITTPVYVPARRIS